MDPQQSQPQQQSPPSIPGMQIPQQPANVPPADNTQNDPPINKKLMLAVILLAVITAVVAFSILRFSGWQSEQAEEPTQSMLPTKVPSPTVVPVSSWPQYVNSKIGFEVRYPPRLGKPRLPSGSSPQAVAVGDETNAHILFGEKSNDYIGLQIFPFTGTLDELLNYKNTPSVDNTAPSQKIQDLTIGSLAAYWYLATASGGNEESGKVKIYFTSGGYGFIIDADKDHDEKEIENMLSTFVFSTLPSPTLNN